MILNQNETEENLTNGEDYHKNISFYNNETIQTNNTSHEYHNLPTPMRYVFTQRNESEPQTILTKLLKLEFDFPKEQGKLGLKNLGNTCYMNCALQVLVHTKELVLYFAKDEYIKELENKESDSEEALRLEFVKNFASLVKEEWSNSKKDVINPIEFRSSLVKLYPFFSENTQQDAHEVLTCILDSLHQYLNRRDNKFDLISNPNIGLTRHLSQKCWESHLEMNDSVITDLFFGQLKSTIKCQSCKFENSAFDPFSSLGLPIPNEYKILVYFIPIKKNNKPIKLFLKINDNMQYKYLIDLVKFNIDYKFNSGIFYFILNNKLIKLIDLDERCGDLMNRPAFLFLIEEEEKEISFSNNETYWEDSFYLCLNFLMSDRLFENCISKTASFPRIFSFNYSRLQSETFNLEERNSREEYDIDDRKIIRKIFDNLLTYVKQYLQGGEDIKELYLNNLIKISVKSVEKITTTEISKTYVCLFCDKETEESFVCSCIDKLIFLQESFSIDNIYNLNSSTLYYYIKNRKVHTEFILEVNVIISKDIIKYKELNRCKDITQRFQVETRLDLFNLLDYFTAEEKLTLEDNFHCQQCGKNVIALKKMEINKFPHILAIHLKRFRLENLGNFGRVRLSRRNDLGSLNQINFSGEKNESLVEFPLNTLELSRYSNKNTNIIYELFAVCNHTGTMHSGHYTAICKHPISKKWVEFDDKIIRNEKSPDTIVSSNAYMLFYRKKQ